MPTPTSNPASTLPHVAAAALLCACAAPTASAQCDGQWLRIADRSGPGTQDAAGAYDISRDRFVMFGGSDSGASDVSDKTREWDGVRWSEVFPAGSRPNARTTLRMAYDSLRNRSIIFGGRGLVGGDPNVFLGDTWSWNGTAWTQLATTGPSARWGAALAYDSARDRIVLFGGSTTSPSTYYAETWEFDGTAWTQIFPAVSPPARSNAGMVYDSARGVCVLFGGSRASFPWYDDTWEWNGVTWTQRITMPAETPQGRGYPNLAYDPDRNRTVLFGGQAGASGADNATWEWDGQAWMRAHDTTADADYPSAGSSRGIIAYDSLRHRTLLRLPYSQGTWAWDGSDWAQLVGSGGQGVMAYDSLNHVALVQTASDTLGWNGATWLYLGRGGPPGRDFFNLASDTLRNQVILFGGRDFNQPPHALSDTWVWNGAAWNQFFGATPPADFSGAMAYDAARDRTVLLNTSSQTWLWNGAAWSQSPAIGPPATSSACMAYDPLRQRIVLFGGRRTPNDIDETWEWDGAAWTRVFPAISPPARDSATLIFDDDCGSIVLFGGRTANNIPFNDMWDYNGATWTQRAQSSRPAARFQHGMTFDPARHIMVMSGGSFGFPFQDPDTYTLASRSCPGDANFDLTVNFADLNITLSNFGQMGQALPGDVNNDGSVNFADLNLILAAFGMAC